MIKDYVTAKERLDFTRGKKWYQLKASKHGYSIELTTGKMLLNNTPMTSRRLQTLVKHGEQVLKEVKTRECWTPYTWSWSA